MTVVASPQVTTNFVGWISVLALLGCVKQLGDVQRHVLTMRVLEELTPQDTARALGLSSGYVAVLLHRAKCALIECLEMEKSDDV